MAPPDSLIEQAKLVEWMAAGQVRAVHVREATPAEVFIARRGPAPGGVRKGEHMHPRLILAMARKDALDLWLDKSKVSALLMPLFLAGLWLLVSSLTSGSQPTPTALLVYNPGQSPLPKFVSSTLTSARITEATSPTEVSAAFEGNHAHSYDVGLIIPADFEQQLRAGSRPQVTLYLNGADLDARQRAMLQGVVTYYAHSVATPRPPLNLVTQAINTGPQPASQPTLGTFYRVMILPISLVVGLNLLPGLIIEEKGKRTLRWLLVSRASLSDILLGKLLVTLAYQLVLSVVVMALLGGFEGTIALLLLYIVLGACLGLALGLLFGVIFQTASAANLASGLSVFIFILPAVIIPLAPFIAGNIILDLVKVLPTYYLADGVNNAIQHVGSFTSNLLDGGVILATTLVLLLVTVWILRRQTSVAGTISRRAMQ
ncbi:MAG TPA: ABC transporter permease [Ktedonosporobacter sp.]|nr:ABC transporter permease [Ktedonosporobacter sp.]